MITRWYRGADEKSVMRLTRGCLTYVSIWIVLAALGVDRFNTVTTLTVFSILTYFAAGALGAVLGARAWFGLNTEQLPASAQARLRTENRGKWLSTGCFWIIFPALTLLFATTRFAGIAAQLMPGVMRTYPGEVREVHPVSTPRTPCRLEIVIEMQGVRHNTRFCLRVSGGTPLGSDSLQAGDQVMVHEKEGVFGRSIESVDYADEAH